MKEETKTTLVTGHQTTSATELSKEQLLAAYDALFRSAAETLDQDAYSLAQPSPYRYVPSTLSNNSTIPNQ